VTAPVRYAVVTPVRDEARLLGAMARSMAAQAHLPVRWVIVDDGSSDETGAIADGLAARHDWIEALHRPRRTTRARGAPIVAAFEAGRARIRVEHDVIVKLDADLHLPAHYFAWVMEVFARVPEAGLVGGTLYVPEGGRWVPDRVGRHTVHGAVKAYRLEAFEAMGGLHPAMGWDGIDEYALRARGWTVHPLSELHVLHHKPRGSRQAWHRARFEEGRGAHHMGYGVPGLALRVGYRMLVEPPPVLGGLALAAGWGWSALTRRPRVPDEAAIALLRAEQRARIRGLLGGRGDLAPAALPGGGPAQWDLEAGAADPEPDVVEAEDRFGRGGRALRAVGS
jgi:hypothetical protein